MDSEPWSLIHLAGSDQLLPVFLGKMQRQTDGILDPKASLLSAPEAPAGRASELEDEKKKLVRKNDLLKKTVDALRAAARRETGRQRIADFRDKQKDSDVVQGCKRVNVAQEEAPRCGMESAKLHSDSDSDLGQAPSRPESKGKEIAITRIFVEMRGRKNARRTAEGVRVGGLSWTEEEMATAAGRNFSLYFVSYATAGAMAASYMRAKAKNVYVTAEALGKHGRRTKLPDNLSLFKDISARSLQRGVNSMQFAKNSAFLDYIRTAHALALAFDSSTISKWSEHGVHVRAFKIVKKGPMDAAGTQCLGVEARSIVLDLLATGDKLTHEYSYTDEDGTQRLAPVEIPRCFALQLMLAGIYWEVQRCRCVSVTCDGGGEGTGLGNRKLARQSMAGRNSVVDLVWLRRIAGDQAVEMLNKHKLFGPLMDFYGFKWKDCNFHSSIPEEDRVNTVRELMKAEAAAVAAARTAQADNDAAMALNKGAAVSLEEEEEEKEEDDDELHKDSGRADDDEMIEIPGDSTDSSHHNVRLPVKCPQPIFDPFSPSPPSQPLFIFDYVVWDVAAACPSLTLPGKISEMTESMVDAVETYASLLIDAALHNVSNAEAFTDIVTLESLAALKPGKMVHDDAIAFVMQPITHALGGRWWVGGGGYSVGPQCSYIQDTRALAENVYVLGTILAAKLEDLVKEAESRRCDTSFEKSTVAMLKILKGRDNRRIPGERAAIGPGSIVFAGTHLLKHFASTEVRHLGQSENSIVITRADSLLDTFAGRVHDALRMGFRAMGLIGESQRVEHAVLALPRQDRVDCAFYMLTRLETLLSGQHLRPELWGLYTRLKRSWTSFLVIRALVHANALRTDVFKVVAQPQSPVAHVLPASPLAVPGALVPMPEPTRCMIAGADDSPWVMAQTVTKKRERAARAKVLQQMNDAKVEKALDEVQGMVNSVWRKQERSMPRRLETSGCVKACTTVPMRARRSPTFSTAWKGRYSDLVMTASARISMQNNPCRYYLMAEQNPTDASDTGPHVQWCIRHRFNCACIQTYRRTDRFPDLAESAINFLRNPHVSHRANLHITAFLGIKSKGGDHVRPGLIHKEVQRAMMAQIDRPGPPGPSTVTTDKLRPSSYEQACALVSGKTGRLPKARPAAATRWGTRPEGQQYLSQTGRLFAVSSIIMYGEASESTLANAARSVHEEKGLVDDQRFRVPPKVGKQLWFLTNQTDIFFCALGRLINVLMVRPCTRAFSKRLECSCFEVCGVGSIFRRSLIFWTADFCVGKFNAADNMGQYRAESQSLRATSHKFNARRKKRGAEPPSAVIRLAHRGWASLRAVFKTAWLINPRANAKIKERFGPHYSEDMLDAVDIMLSTMRRVAGMWGNGSEMLLYPTLEKEYQARMALTEEGEVRMRSLLKMSENSSDEAKSKALYASNMRKMQFAVVQVVQQDIISAIVEWHDHELYSLFGFLGSTFLAVKLSAQEKNTGQIVEIVTAHPDAVANALIASRMLDELFAHYPNDKLSNFVPTQLADLLNDEKAMGQFSRLCQGEAVEDFVLVDEQGNPLTNPKTGKAALPIAPLERYEDLAHQILKIVLTQLSSNDIERIFSQASMGFNRGGKNVSPMAINSWCRRNDWVSGGFWGLEKDEMFLKKFRNARLFFRAYESSLRKIMEPDTETSETRKMCARQDRLPARNKQGQRFGTSNIQPQAKAFHFGPLCPGRDEFNDSMDQSHQVQSKTKIAQRNLLPKGVARKREAMPVHRKATSGQSSAQEIKDNALRRKARKARALHRDIMGPRGPPLVSLQTMSLMPSIATNEDQDGCETPHDETHGDDQCKDKSGEAGPPNDKLSEKAAAKADVPQRGGFELSTGSMPIQIVEGNLGKQGLPAAATEAVKGGPWAALHLHHAKPALHASTMAEASPNAFGDQDQNSGEDREVENRSLRIAAATPARWNSGEVENRYLKIARNLLAKKQENEAESWSPSVITRVTRDQVDLKRFDGTSFFVSTRGRSGCLMYLAYEPHSGEVRPIQILSVKVKRSCASATGTPSEPASERGVNGILPEGIEQIDMSYCYVYSTKSAIRNCEQEEDKENTRTDEDGHEIVSRRRGRRSLRIVDEQRKLQYHMGDVCHRTSRGGLGVHNIVGHIAWLTAAYLIGDDDGKGQLRTMLRQAGVPSDEAGKLANFPLYIGDHFLENRPERSTERGGDSGEESEQSDAEGLISAPSREPLRVARSTSLSCVDPGDQGGESDDLDEPILAKCKVKRRRMPRQTDSSKSSEVAAGAGVPAGQLRKRGGDSGCRGRPIASGEAQRGEMRAKPPKKRGLMEDSDDNEPIFAARASHGRLEAGSGSALTRQQLGKKQHREAL
jgi:hypothetical protein